jgi:hypothetical protein
MDIGDLDMGAEHETCKMPDESCETLIDAELRGMGQTDHPMLDCRCACTMCTFGTAYPAVSSEGKNSTNALKNCAKTAAKTNVRHASELDEFQHMRSGYLELYTHRAQPPCRS